MAAHDRHADAGAGDIHLRQVHDLAAFVLELHLLGGVALALLAADLGDDVVGDLVGKDLGLVALALLQGLDLIAQLHRASSAGAGDSLIGADDHALDVAELPQGVDSGHSDDRGAVGVGDDAVVLFHVLGVHFRNHQRGVRIQAEGGGIVHEHGAGLHDGILKALGDVVLGGTQNDVQALKGVVLGLFHDDVLALEGDDLTRAAGAGEEVQLADGEIPLGEDLLHFLTDCAAGAENTDFVRLHFNKLLF